MSRLVRRLIVGGISVLIVLWVSVFAFSKYLEARIATSMEFERAKITSATVLSVVEVKPAKPPKADHTDRLYMVCFTIDNLDQIRSDMRQEYQSAEARRLASEGPRCKATTKVAIAKALGKGDKLSVVYLLENQGIIVLVSVMAFGEDL
jgi:hypothetical protein